VPRLKQSRKQRAAAAKAAAAQRAAQPPAKKDFLADGRARFSAYLWAISLTFAYGVVNDLGLGRPEPQVSGEALAVCIATLVARVFFYYAPLIRMGFSHRVTERLWVALQQLSRRRFARMAGASALTFVLVMSAAPIGGVEPAIAARRLEKSDIGLLPGVDSDLRGSDPAYRFREVSTRIERTIKERLPGDPNTVNEVKGSLARIVQNVRLPENVAGAAKLELAYLQSYETLSLIGAADPRILHQISSGYTPAIPAMIGAGVDKTTFVFAPSATTWAKAGPIAWGDVDTNPRFFSGFTVIFFGHPPPGSQFPQFAFARGDSTAVVFNDIKIEGLAQDVGNLSWTNVTFQGCLIRYHGQPLRMGNVRFFNCTFERSPDGKGQQLLDYLSTHQGEPVDAYVP
jgi:hypothetical protein